MIYIVRHGQTDWNVEGRYQGRIDIELNQVGINQAEEIAEKLKDVRFDYVFSSPLIRAYDTASIISSDCKIKKDNRLIERCNGELEGKLKKDFDNNINFNDPLSNEYGIESIVDFRKRIKSFCKMITKEKYKGKNLLIVTHAGVSIYIRCFFEGEPADNNYNNYKLKNCEVLVYDND